MSQFFYIHPDNPQGRLISQAAAIVKNGGVVVYPTDSGYAIGCAIGDKKAMDRIIAIRNVDGYSLAQIIFADKNVCQRSMSDVSFQRIVCFT